MRKFFEEPTVEVTVLAVEDVIATSGEYGGSDSCEYDMGGF